MVDLEIAGQARNDRWIKAGSVNSNKKRGTIVRTVSSAASKVASGEAPQEVYRDTLFRTSKGVVVAAPAPEALAGGTRIADTHAHLDMLHNPELALMRAAAHGVDFIVSVIDPTEDPACTLDNAEGWLAAAAVAAAAAAASTLAPAAAAAASTPAPELRLIMGCHPHNAARYTAETERWVVESLRHNKRVVGIGEIGLDYHYDNSPRDTQQQVFRRQIQLAHEHGSTIALHLREAHEDGLRILREEGLPQAGALLHCFNLDYATLEPFLELGCLAAFGGPLTFKKAEEVRQAAARTPKERIVTETDCPFMAPVPLRGTVCEPASVIYTAAQLAAIHPAPDVLTAAYNNARSFFA